jgi:alpha-D-ribose 1-methylphosphonate 5-triphosphate diphosphatase
MALVGGRILTPLGMIDDAVVHLAEGRIVAMASDVGAGTGVCDVSGCTLLPGIIDLHGDAVERAIAPRPGVTLPLPMALAENDAALLAAGVTTAFLSVTDGFEPGLRSRAQVRAVRQALSKVPLACDTRLHVRHEMCLTSDHAELLEWLADGSVHLLSTADHLPEGDDAVKLERYRAAARRRLALADAELDRLIAQALTQRALGRLQESELAAAAGRYAIPLASHDDASEELVDAALARGVRISEFPLSPALAARARAGGAAVLMGAPNYVRGGSHVAWMSVSAALAAGVVDCLCSDYHHPSLYHAPWMMAAAGDRPFAEAWALVSEAPARAARLGDRKGRIAPGYDADLLVVDAERRLRSVYVAGRKVAHYH